MTADAARRAAPSNKSMEQETGGSCIRESSQMEGETTELKTRLYPYAQRSFLSAYQKSCPLVVGELGHDPVAATTKNR